MFSSRIRSLNSCVERSGRVDLEKYRQFKRQKTLQQQSVLNQTIQNILQVDQETEEDEPKRRSPRTVKRHPIQYRDHEGELREMTPQMSLWYCLYVNSPVLESEKFHHKFRRRFRMPYASFLQILSWVKQHDSFQRWQRKDAFNNPASPIELLVLGSLRYLGRGWTFDDLEELTCVNEETHRQFFHCFIAFGGSYLYDKFVKSPSTKEDVESAMAVFTEAGMPGCFLSSDATHVGLEKCSHYLAQAHKASKLPMPARTYNLNVTHDKLILSTTSGHPAKWNDKTLQLFDPLLKPIFQGDILQDVTFTLLERKEDGEVFEASYRGVWCLVDNGYVNWSTTIPPLKQPASFEDVRWSKWLESMRKDVECTFGIMKGRFRLLKTGIRLHAISSCDRVWKTCCALHNYLLKIDGLDGDSNSESIWLGELGNHDPLDRLRHPRLQREDVIDPADFPLYDASGMGVGNDGRSNNPYLHQESDQEDGSTSEDPQVSGGKSFAVGDPRVRVVRELSLHISVVV